MAVRSIITNTNHNIKRDTDIQTNVTKIQAIEAKVDNHIINTQAIEAKVDNHISNVANKFTNVNSTLRALSSNAKETFEFVKKKETQIVELQGTANNHRDFLLSVRQLPQLMRSDKALHLNTIPIQTQSMSQSIPMPQPAAKDLENMFEFLGEACSQYDDTTPLTAGILKQLLAQARERVKP